MKEKGGKRKRQKASKNRKRKHRRKERQKAREWDELRTVRKRHHGLGSTRYNMTARDSHPHPQPYRPLILIFILVVLILILIVIPYSSSEMTTTSIRGSHRLYAKRLTSKRSRADDRANKADEIRRCAEQTTLAGDVARCRQSSSNVQGPSFCKLILFTSRRQKWSSLDTE